MKGAVAEVWRYPVKSAGAEYLSNASVTTSGLRGDRAWGVLRADGTVASAKKPEPSGRLLVVAVREEPDGLWLTLPDGSHVLAGTAACDVSLSTYLDEMVTLTRQVPPNLRLHRAWPEPPGMVPDWQEGLPGHDALTPVVGAATGSFRDFGAVHIVTTGALGRLEERQGCHVDPLRFRPNLVLDLPEDPPPGATLRVGEVLLTVLTPTPRCVVPALEQPGLAALPTLLTTLAHLYRQPVLGLGRAACFGFYADVQAEGVLGTESRVYVM